MGTRYFIECKIEINKTKKQFIKEFDIKKIKEIMNRLIISDNKLYNQYRGLDKITKNYLKEHDTEIEEILMEFKNGLIKNNKDIIEFYKNKKKIGIAFFEASQFVDLICMAIAILMLQRTYRKAEILITCYESAEYWGWNIRNEGDSIEIQQMYKDWVYADKYYINPIYK